MGAGGPRRGRGARRRHRPQDHLVGNRSSEKASYDRDGLAELLSYTDGDLGDTDYEKADVNLRLGPPPSLEELADTYGDPDGGDFRPVLKFHIAPEVKEGAADGPGVSAG